LMAAIYAANSKAETIIVETNTAAGRKLLQTGRGRCNLTHAGGTIDDFIRAFGRRGRFLRYCFHEFTPEQIRGFFTERGLQTKIEEDGSVFPVTDKASDVKKVLLAETEKLGVRFLYGRRVDRIERSGEDFTVYTNKQAIVAKKVIIATGGVSWPHTGSVGDGYRLARELGHEVVEQRASLVPLVTSQSWPGHLAGIAIGDVKISTMLDRKKVVFTGPMLFTHDGIGGPAVLDLSSFLTDFLPAEKKAIDITIDLVVDLGENELERKILEQFEGHPKKELVNILAGFVPRRLAVILCSEFGFEGNIYGSGLKKDERKRLVRILKNLPLSITTTRPIAEALVTRGGVSIEQIDTRTMESKICPGLFFAGEVMDVDGPCGGYNLQICWSTGAIAGRSAGQQQGK